MKRWKLPGFVDLYEVNDPSDIKTLAQDSRLDRKFERSTCPVNWLLIQRSLKVLSFDGHRFPTIMPREDSARAQKQQQLWNTLSARAIEIQNGPDELEPLANWVRGVGSDAEVGIIVQGLLGRLFTSQFVATPASWAAARTLVAAPRSMNLPQMVWWCASGKVRRAKRLLAILVNNDLSGVNAIGIAVHNVVKSVRHMKVLYADVAMRTSLTAETATEECLFAPVRLLRQATADGQLGDCPFSKDSLFLLRIGEACRQPGGRPLVFMDNTWSQCPANLWVPAMLQGLWNRALR